VEQLERALATRLYDAQMDVKGASKLQQQQDVISKLEQQAAQMRDAAHASHAAPN
jgi:hypothetical protein